MLNSLKAEWRWPQRILVEDHVETHERMLVSRRLRTIPNLVSRIERKPVSNIFGGQTRANELGVRALDLVNSHAVQDTAPSYATLYGVFVDGAAIIFAKQLFLKLLELDQRLVPVFDAFR